MKQNPCYLLILLTFACLANACHLFQKEYSYSEQSDNPMVRKFIKKCKVKKDFYDLRKLNDYILKIDYSQYDIYLHDADYNLFGGGVCKDVNYIMSVNHRPEGRWIFRLNYKLFDVDKFKNNLYQKYFHVNYHTPELYIQGNNEGKALEKRSEDTWGVTGSSMILFPIDKEYWDEEYIIIKIEIREHKIIEGKSPPSPEKMKKMMEDILLRFQDCLE